MKVFRVTTLLLLILCAGAAWAQQSATPPPPPTVSRVLNSQLSNAEKEFVDAADAMPEEKYGFAPTSGEFKGVRTFSMQVKHVAAVNYLLAAAITGGKPAVDIGSENGPASMTSKADIMKFLRDSFATLHESLGKVTPENQTSLMPSPFGPGKMTVLGMAVIGISHPFDHYGQMVEYLRMNGIIPPASRPQPAPAK